MATLNFKNPDTGKWEEIGGGKKLVKKTGSYSLIGNYSKGDFVVTDIKFDTSNDLDEYFIPVAVIAEYAKSRPIDTAPAFFFISHNADALNSGAFHVCAIMNKALSTSIGGALFGNVTVYGYLYTAEEFENIERI